MKLVMVGGHTRNIGKTSVVEGIIKALPEMSWTAVKITQFGHGVCSANGQSCGCVVTEHPFAITQERLADSGTDTARFLAAGARRALWVRTRQGELQEALPALTKAVASDEFVIVESNSLRRFLKPALYLQVIDPGNLDFKQSARQFFDLTDAYLVVTSSGEATPCQAAKPQMPEMRADKPCFPVDAKQGFVSPAVIDFVRTTLTA